MTANLSKPQQRAMELIRSAGSISEGDGVATATVDALERMGLVEVERRTSNKTVSKRAGLQRVQVKHWTARAAHSETAAYGNRPKGMTYDEVQPDTRVICHSRGDIKGTVLRKFVGGKDNAEQLVHIAFDEGGPAYNRPEQLSPLDEAAPEPMLSRAYKGSSTFWLGGHEYEVFNSTGVGDVRGYWACIRRSHDGKAHTNEAYIVVGASTREAAFEIAVEKLKVREVVEIRPRRDGCVTVPADEYEGWAYPEVRRDGWVAAWHADGYLIVFEDKRERGIVWTERPIEAKIIGRDGREHDLDGEYRHIEAAVAAIREYHL